MQWYNEKTDREKTYCLRVLVFSMFEEFWFLNAKQLICLYLSNFKRWIWAMYIIVLMFRFWFFFFILISKYCCSIVRTSLKELESKSIIAISFLHSPQTILHDSGSSQPQPLYSQMKARFLSRTGKALESSSHPLFSEEWDRLNIFQLQQKPSRVMSECGMVKSRGR